jgi:hypothetical protein
LSVAQYFTKTVLRNISLYFFLRCLPHSYLYHAPPCPAARSQSTGPCPVHCSMRRQRIRTDSIYLLFIIEDSILLTKYKYTNYNKGVL